MPPKRKQDVTLITEDQFASLTRAVGETSKKSKADRTVNSYSSPNNNFIRFLATFPEGIKCLDHSPDGSKQILREKYQHCVESFSAPFLQHFWREENGVSSENNKTKSITFQ